MVNVRDRRFFFTLNRGKKNNFSSKNNSRKSWFVPFYNTFNIIIVLSKTTNCFHSFQEELNQLCCDIEKLMDDVFDSNINVLDAVRSMQSLYYFSKWPKLEDYYQTKIKKLFDNYLSYVNRLMNAYTKDKHLISACMPRHAGICTMAEIQIGRLKVLEEVSVYYSYHL